MLQLYSLQDKKSGSFSKPFFAEHVADATRSVQAAFDMPPAQQPWFVKYPADYALYMVGTFDQHSGAIMSPQQMAPQWVIEVASLSPLKSPLKEGAVS